MIENNINLKTPARIIKGRVAFYEGATLKTADYNTNLIDIKVDRVGENGKFYGFGVSQKVTITIQDKNREINPADINNISVYFTTIDADAFTPVLIDLKVEKCTRNENNNNITIICNDKLIETNTITVNELGLEGNYYINLIIKAILTKLNLSGFYYADSLLSEEEIDGFNELITMANLDGTENVRSVLDDFAEVLHMIYFVNAKNRLVFMPLSYSESVLNITKSDYFTLKVGNTYTLATTTHITELGDNITYTKSGVTGIEQVIRDNCFLDNNPNAGLLLESVLDSSIGGFSMTEFSLSWRGNYYLEIGDKISITTKDNQVIEALVINDSFTYNGGLKQETSWSYAVQETPAANPTNIGDAINHTFARVDKINKQITLLASKEEANREDIATLKVNTDNIASSVKAVEDATKQNAENVNKDIAELESKITQTAESLNIDFTNKINGIDSVTTSTGFSFDKDGLKVSKSGSEMTTQITEDGMIVYRNNDAMLTANNTGVNAVNLHATTYLIIGNNSRFEDMGSSRTGCFWIGG